MKEMDSMLKHLDPDLTVAEAAPDLIEQRRKQFGSSVYEGAFRLFEQFLGETSVESIQAACIWTGKQIWPLSPLLFIWLATRPIPAQAAYAAELSEIHQCSVGSFLIEVREVALALWQLREKMAKGKQPLEKMTSSQGI
jgi:hypothetical protein